MIFFAIFTASASLKSYKELIILLMKKKLQFFDTTPIGQILTLVSKDQDITDKNMPYDFFMMI